MITCCDHTYKVANKYNETSNKISYLHTWDILIECQGIIVERSRTLLVHRYQVAFYRESSRIYCFVSRTPHGSQISSHLLKCLRLVTGHRYKHMYLCELNVIMPKSGHLDSTHSIAVYIQKQEWNIVTSYDHPLPT